MLAVFRMLIHDEELTAVLAVFGMLIHDEELTAILAGLALP